MTNISFVTWSPHNGDHSTTAQVVECYREVFADTPWNEWLRCCKCSKYWGKKDGALLASMRFLHCGVPLTDFWSRDQVVADFLHEITEESSCWLAINDNQVVGFTLGYPIDSNQLMEKLGLEFRIDFHFVRYQDDIGLLSPYRQSKVGKALNKRCR